MDFETNETVFKIQYEILDFSVLPLKKECSATVQIIDLNDNIPKFIDLYYTVEFNDSISANVSFLTVEAFDEDSGKNSELSYSINDRYKLFKVI